MKAWDPPHKALTKTAGYLTRVLVLLFVVLCRADGHCAESMSILFYSSETSINNFKSLKMEFDRYLSEAGPYELQPFKEKGTFEKQAIERPKVLLLLSAWHYAQLSRDCPLRPLFVGTRGGKKYQRMILVAKADASKSDPVSLDPLASASSIPHTRSVLSEMLHGGGTDGINVLSVPKDMDALVSVGFGMSRSALSTESSLHQLEAANPSLYSEIKILAEGRESLSLVMAVPKGFDRPDEKILSMIRGMASSPKGKAVLEMIGLDGWKELDSSDISSLGGK